MEGKVWLQTERSSWTAAGEQSALPSSAQAGSTDVGCSQSNTLPPPPEGFSGADKATPLLKLRQTQTDRQTSGVNGWCHFESWTLGSDVIHDMELKAAFTQHTPHLLGYLDRERWSTYTSVSMCVWILNYFGSMIGSVFNQSEIQQPSLPDKTECSKARQILDLCIYIF